MGRIGLLVWTLVIVSGCGTTDGDTRSAPAGRVEQPAAVDDARAVTRPPRAIATH